MISQKKVDDLVQISLITDAYCLGSHWVYDEKQLKENDLDWNDLNSPLAIWHKGKQKGDFTHYGDHTLWLYEFLKNKHTFDEKEYAKYWQEQMSTYTGYIDGSSRNTLENIENNVFPCGSDSSDLSIIGRIAPLLKVSNSKEEFLQNVEKFVKVTHNSKKAIIASRFFAMLLQEVLDGNDIKSSLLKVQNLFDETVQGFVKQGLESKNKDSFISIREFGPACDISEGFSGVIHLLSKYDNLKDMLIENAKAGGDTSARAMICSIIFMANNSINNLPQNWFLINKKEIIAELNN
ncbi:ADP-ribosylglycohydrolase family protein [Poseidonibacter sp.]|uniref:ADP-ribosylglycohydrolase family protein n=1 Tax=Poseidonibacter sp. TaxID=2321188 RepID=UPI003C75537C